MSVSQHSCDVFFFLGQESEPPGSPSLHPQLQCSFCEEFNASYSDNHPLKDVETKSPIHSKF